MKKECGLKCTCTQKAEDSISVSVEAVLNKLKQLALQTKKRDESDNQKLWKQYEYLANEIALLAKQRDEVHDALELQTIKSCRKRKCFQILPIQYADEMKTAVLAARDTNNSIIRELKEQFIHLRREVVSCEERHKKLSAENTALLPQCRSIQGEYDETVVQLNKRISDRSAQQIKLNESRQMLHEFQHQIDEIDDGMLELAEDIGEERQQAIATRTDLNQEIKEVEEALAEHNAVIAEEKRLNRTYMELTLSKASKICGMKKEIAELENAIPLLKKEGKKLITRINRKRKTITEIGDASVGLQANIEKETTQYMEKVNALEETLENLRKQSDEAKSENKEIVKDRTTILLQQEKLKKTFKKLVQKVEALSTIHAELKKELAKLGHEFLSTQEKNQKKMEQIEGSKKHHRVAKFLLQKQIEEQKKTLGVEKQDRIETQKLRDESEDALEEFVKEEAEYMSQKAEELDNAASDHIKLTDRGLHLLRENVSNKSLVDTLREKLDDTQVKLSGFKSYTEQELLKIEKNLKLIQNEENRLLELYNSKQPGYFKLRQEVNTLDEELQEQKQKEITMSNKHMTLIQKKNRAKMLIGKLHKPMEEMKSQMKSLRKEGVNQLEKHSTQSSILETGMYFITHKLEAIMHENEVLVEHTDEISGDAAELKADIEINTLHQKNLCHVLTDIDEQLQVAWDYAVALQKQLAEDGHVTMDCLAIVQQDTKERSDRLAGITTDLRTDLEDLNNIMDGGKDRKPEGVNETNRKPQSFDLKQASNVSRETRDPRRRSSVRTKKSSIHQDEKLLRARRASSRLIAHSNRRSTINALSVDSSRQRRFSAAILRPSLIGSDVSSARNRPVNNTESGAEITSPSVTFKQPSVERLMTIHVPGLEPHLKTSSVATG